MIGKQIGQLTVKSKLGEGGMGAVYYAEHEILRTQRVIKTLLPQWTQNAMMVHRFVNEARAAASIKHPSIIEVHDCGQLPDGTWYIVMDYLEGGTLGQFGAAHSGPMSTHLALKILAPTADGLEAAHRRSIVHRDLKPDNIFLTKRGWNSHHPVILDFGIAKLGELEGGAITRTGMMAGTPAYMAPEQMRDLKLVDRRSDVYALGVITYQLVTGGWLPYQEEATPAEFNQLSAAEIYHRQKSRPPIDPRERCPGLSEGWAAAIRAAIDPDPARRHQTPRAFVLMLAQATVGDDFTPSGTEIVRTYANELLEIGNLLETVRAPKPAGKPSASASSRYQLGDRLGAGGMAEVFRGTMSGAEGFARPVAIKRVLPGFSEVPQFASMFVQEAQIASQLSHPNIVSVLDFDRDPDGRLFLVMEYVEGRDLASLAATGPLPPSIINFIISETLRGLGYAHELPSAGPIRGLVHRDVSPQNVLLSWEGAVKVSDFGIAKARQASAATASTLIKGKPQYMSPEQARGEDLDGRSDLFAAGVMLWELLTDESLFDGTAHEALAQVMFRAIPRPSSVRPEIPSDLEAVAMRLLERERSARYANAELAIDDLAQCADAPRNGRGDLARVLAARFPDAIASRVSRSQLGGGSSPSGAPPSRATVRDEKVTARERAAQFAARDGSWPSPETTLGTAASQSVARRHTGSRWRLRVAAGVVAGAGFAIATLVATRFPDRESQPAGQPPEQAIASGGSSEGSAAKRSVQITVLTEPPGALVRVDGVALGKSPVTVPSEIGRRLLIEAVHDGFEPEQRTVTSEREAQAITLVLAALRAAPPVDAAVPSPPDAGGKRRATQSLRPVEPRRDSGPRKGGSGSFDRDAVVGD